MLRALVLLLLLLNGAYFAWSQDLLAPWGLAPASQSEPQRVRQQINPRALRLLSPGEAAQLETAVAAAASTSPAQCLRYGVFDTARAAALRPQLESTLPVGSWRLESAVEPARWIVYMGKYPNVEQLNRKKAELNLRKVAFQPLRNPSLEPGLSLGAFPSQAEAERALEDLGRRDVRTARVVLESPEQRGQALVLPVADAALRARLDRLKPVLAGVAAGPCA